MKLCNTCGTKERLSYGYKCKDCHCAYQKKWHKENPQSINASSKTRKDELRRYIRNKKESSPCKDCGIFYPWYVMDFDHVKGKKKFNVSISVQKYSKEIIDEEIAKCELVCANCHRQRTFARA